MKISPVVLTGDRATYRAEALKYLAYSLVRSASGFAETGILEIDALDDTHATEDPSWYYWNRVDDDPDFQDLLDDIGPLKTSLIRHLQADRQLFRTEGPAFEDTITRILAEAGALASSHDVAANSGRAPYPSVPHTVGSGAAPHNN